MMKNDPDLPGIDAKTQSSVHAECAALQACRKADLKGATIYVARINKKGTPLMSKPCERCEATLREAGVNKMVWTLDSSKTL